MTDADTGPTPGPVPPGSGRPTISEPSRMRWSTRFLS